MQTHWIDNKAVASESSEAIAIINPANEQTLDTIPRGHRADAERATASAIRAQPGWEALSPTERKNALKKIGVAMQAQLEDLARLLTQENGKTLAQSRGEINAAIDLLNSFAELGVHLRSGYEGAPAGELVFQHRQARGVAACIVPWNYPIMTGIGNVIPNLVVGNTVVWKPSEKTPLSSRMLVERCFASLPPGVVNLLLGDGPNAGEPLVVHPAINVVAFIGSERTGRRIGETCGRMLKKCVLELGGKDPLIVDETVNIKAAARLAAEATYTNAGQICTSTERLYVHRSVMDAFITALVEESRTLRLGDGLEAGTQMGPLVDHLQLGKVEEQVKQAVGAGAQVHCGGGRLERTGFFFPPTVMTGIRRDMLLMEEETFGPIAPVMPFDDFDEAIALANDCTYGLAAIVCTTSAPRAIKALQSIQAGMIKINTMRGRAPGSTSEPFKASGIGHGYGVEMLYELSIQKSVHWRGEPR
jgi:acyl-CoA reductase-like NAD-dependent aldehyde dehydrogenase